MACIGYRQRIAALVEARPLLGLTKLVRLSHNLFP
jgi:hypothetical protein